jgi:hypothetical protein
MLLPSIQSGKILRDLHGLKIFMSDSEPKSKDPEIVLATPEEVERRLLNETIDEVLGINNNEQEIEIQQERSKRSPQPPSFADKVQQAIALSPTLNRSQVEDPGLTINDIHRTDIAQIAATDDLPEGTNEVLADLGMYNTPFGRRLYDKVNGLESQRVPPEAMQIEDIGGIPDLMEDSSAPMDSPAIVLEVDVPVRPSNLPEVRTPVRFSTQPVASPAEIRPAPRPSVPRVIREKDPPPRASVVESELEKIATEAAERLKNAPKPRRVQRRKLKTAAAEPTTIDERHKPLKVIKVKPLVPRGIFVPIHFETEFDLNDYQDDEAPEADDRVPLSSIIGLDAEPMMIGTPLIHHTQTPMVSPARQLATSTPDAQQVLELPRRLTLASLRPSVALDAFQAKRPRIEVSDVDNDQIEIPEVDAIDFVPPVMADLRPSMPQVDRQAGVNSKPRNARHVDLHDMEFANWQHKSQSHQPVVGQPTKAPEASRPQRSINEDEFDENGNQLFRRSKGKYDTMIEFIGNDHRVKKCSNYSMEVS